jgi:hypothetical protein
MTALNMTLADILHYAICEGFSMGRMKQTKLVTFFQWEGAPFSWPFHLLTD